MLKVTENRVFTFFVETVFLEKPQGGDGNAKSPVLFEMKDCNFILMII